MIHLAFQTLRSPVPAGSRVTFFAGPKKVTKERAGAALGISVADLRWFRAPKLQLRVGASSLAPLANRSGVLGSSGRFYKIGRQGFPRHEAMAVFVGTGGEQNTERWRKKCQAQRKPFFCLLFVG